MPRRISIDITISSPKKSLIFDKESATKVTVGIYPKNTIYGTVLAATRRHCTMP